MAVARRERSIDAAVRVEWPVPLAEKERLYVDVLIEAEDGRPVEIVECKEHQLFIPLESFTKFLHDVQRIVASGAASEDTVFRFVTNGQLVRRGRSRDLDVSRGEGRKTLLTEVLPADFRAIARDLEPRLRWQMGHAAKEHLSSDTLLEMSWHLGGDREKLLRLYFASFVRLAAQQAYRRPEERDEIDAMLLDVHFDLFHHRKAGEWWSAFTPDPNTFPAAELRAELFFPGGVRGRTLQEIAVAKVQGSLRRNVFENSNLRLEDIYVEPRARLRDPRSGTAEAPAAALLLRWIAENRYAPKADRRPMLLLAPFGAGKSVFVTAFANELSNHFNDLSVIMVPLRDLKAVASRRGLAEALDDHLRRDCAAELLRPEEGTGQICLLLDGFDELSLYFAARKSEEWVEQCLRDLEMLAELPHVLVVVSSRPILLMDAGRPGFAFDKSPRMELLPFSEEQIRRWCANYVNATGSAEELSWEFLGERGLADVARNPLVLYMIASLLTEKTPALWESRRFSRAEIYRLFVERTVRGSYMEDGVKYRLPDDYPAILRDVAWLIFQHGEPYLSAERILVELRRIHGEAIHGIPVDRTILNAHMLQTAGGVPEAKERDLVEFSHQSFAEFLVAQRVWETLAPLRRGEPATIPMLDLLGERPYGDSEIAFLTDMVAALPADEAKAMQKTLQADAAIAAAGGEWRRCVLAAFFLILRLRCLDRLRELDAAPPLEELLESSLCTEVRNLLDRLAVVGRELPVARAARTTLLRNLQQLTGRSASFDRQLWSGAVLRGATLPRAAFVGAELMDVDLAGARLTNADLRRSAIRPQDVTGAVFRKAELEGAMFLMPGRVLADADFAGAGFQRVRFVGFAFRRCAFIGNDWTGAMIQPLPHQPLFVEHCTVDDAARRFFEANGVEMRDCE